MDIKAEKITPYTGDNRDKGDQVREMFDNIAPAYDFMNRAMTMGIDKWWRQKAIKSVSKHLQATQLEQDKENNCNNLFHSILDVATGTGDLAILLAKKFTNAKVTGIDLSQRMVEIGRKKVEQNGLADRVSLGIGNCLALPFTENEFVCITVAYGVRNFERLLDGYKEMLRVLKPGGMVCVIELSTPTSPVIKPLYNFYSGKVIPFFGKIISKDTRAYSYLPESIAASPQGATMIALMESAGFIDCSYETMTFGTCTIYTGHKPH